MRVHRSMTVARYSHPSPVRRYVMSPTRRVPGTAEVKSLPMRSAKTFSGSEGIVVRLKARIRFAAHPFSAMIAATVPTDTSTPSVTSLVWTIRWPKIPSEESNMVFTCPVSSRRRAAVADSFWSSHR